MGTTKIVVERNHFDVIVFQRGVSECCKPDMRTFANIVLEISLGIIARPLCQLVPKIILTSTATCCHMSSNTMIQVTEIRAESPPPLA